MVIDIEVIPYQMMLDRFHRAIVWRQSWCGLLNVGGENLSNDLPVLVEARLHQAVDLIAAHPLQCDIGGFGAFRSAQIINRHWFWQLCFCYRHVQPPTEHPEWCSYLWFDAKEKFYDPERVIDDPTAAGNDFSLPWALSRATSPIRIGRVKFHGAEEWDGSLIKRYRKLIRRYESCRQTLDRALDGIGVSLSEKRALYLSLAWLLFPFLRHRHSGVSASQFQAFVEQRLAS